MNYYIEEPYYLDQPLEKKQAIVLINIGSPTKAQTKNVKSYLARFLSDRRIIEMNPILWQPILKGIILNIRPRKSALKYRTIWDKDKGSPLTYYTQEQAESLQELIKNKTGKNISVKYAMNYSDPSLKNVLDQLKKEKVTDLIIIPMFPQYSFSTSSASLDKIWKLLLKTRYQPNIKTINQFHDFQEYINVCAHLIQQFWKNNPPSEKLIFSFHGIPILHDKKGDPYRVQCIKTVKLIVEKLKLSDEDYLIAFQSRFGKIAWLQPSTQELFSKLPTEGIKSIDVFCPNFTCDCLETLEEIATEGKKLFLNAGGEQFHYIPSFNTEKKWIEALYSLVKKEIDNNK